VYVKNVAKFSMQNMGLRLNVLGQEGSLSPKGVPMREKREEIIKLLVDLVQSNRHAYKPASETADSILSLLSTRILAQKCVCKPNEIVCPYCDGTLPKSRELTHEELAEWAIELIKFCESHPFYAHNPDMQALILPTGERLVVKERR
jgi:hypothetical protein